MSQRPPSPPESDRLYRQIVASAVDYAIIATDLHGLIVSWSEGASRLLGWTEADMVGQRLDRFFTPEDRAAGAPQREMETAQRTGRAADERWHLKRSGERFWASGELMPLRDEAGAMTGFVKIVRDRTQHQLADAKLRQLNDTLKASEERLQLRSTSAAWACGRPTCARRRSSGGPGWPRSTACRPAARHWAPANIRA